MKIYAYDLSNSPCTIEIPQGLKDSYICTFGISTPAKNQVEKWLEKKGYEVKQRGAETEFISIQIGD